MRIIAGERKGCRLFAPTWEGLRPTSDRLRETLFNVLRDDVVGARWLDGCAGTGAIGLEAISRGAMTVTFVECDHRAIALIRKNIAQCRTESRAVVVEGALPDGLARSIESPCFDVCVLDPPYEFDTKKIGDILTGVKPYVAQSGLIVLERPRRAAVVEVPGLVTQRCINSGDSALYFYG
tara:strand:+ start:22 stop:561 length:540 start_codon:yes stop_codon:yes gene_type:complete